MTLKEEFEKAFRDKVYTKPSSQLFSRECALWAAKWMADKIIKFSEKVENNEGCVVADDIIQFSKELQDQSMLDVEAENKALTKQNSDLQGKIRGLVEALEWYSNSGNYCYDKKSKHISTGYEDGRVENKAKEALLRYKEGQASTQNNYRWVYERD